MERVLIDLKDKSYTIHIEGGLLKSLSDYLGQADKWLLITDDHVDQLYGAAAEDALKNKEMYKVSIPPGEGSKTMETVEKILASMIGFGLTRKSKVIALGGGVVGDIAGFCASIYMRGIPFIQVPTTLLSQVDSSVGGKTGVNLPQGKNIVGSFYQPEAVIIDTDTLKTLPKKELVSGIGEVIKYGIIYDYNFLQNIKNNFNEMMELQGETMKNIIKKCCEIKAEVVIQDEKEQGLRKILNYGHTIGHGLEAVTKYNKYTHGEAVLIGMYYEALMAKNFGYIGKGYFEEIEALIRKVDITLDITEFSLEALVEAMMKDKKNKEGKISFILPKERGQVKEVLLSSDEVVW
ncbi:3-dehydroquinate synthase [Natronincola peptidivorans]|uniref:3-dehydroquinate synthase n=1 Tax=Natronincola peptidivorans TaxID=426128 RepID=A0A1I0A665_9FIRM|nr:3-dehydroquinate synthase [Natronincola peptidivorans]SES89171.1 3-dehydroquinate synthase [Natronincola peptidivorans]